MNLCLVDLDAELVAAWRVAFAPFSEVSIRQADLLEVASNCVVSPSNGYGFMDGGIDAAYRAHFGRRIERIVRDAISRRPEGHLPVGASLVVRTGHERIPFMIVAPTMLMPEPVPGENSFRAMMAVLRVAIPDAQLARAVYCPGLGTGVGMIPPTEAAAMMARAYAHWRRVR